MLIASGATTPRMKAREVDNRTEAQARRFERRRLAGAHAVLSFQSRELDDQDGVLRRQTDERHHADLKTDVVE